MTASLLFGPRSAAKIGSNDFADVEAVELLELLNSRLYTSRLVAVGVATGYDDSQSDDQWNGRWILRQELLPMFDGVISVKDDNFSEDSEVFAQIEKLSGELLCWDDDTVHDPRPVNWILHRLMDVQPASIVKLRQIASALHEVTPAERREIVIQMQTEV